MDKMSKFATHSCESMCDSRWRSCEKSFFSEMISHYVPLCTSWITVIWTFTSGACCDLLRLPCSHVRRIDQ